MPDKKNKPLKPSAKPPKWLKFRALDDDEDIIDAKAKETGLSRSEYMRRMSRDGEIIINNLVGAAHEEIIQIQRHGYNIIHLLKEYRTRGHPPPGNLEALYATQQQYYKQLLEQALQGVEI